MTQSDQSDIVAGIAVLVDKGGRGQQAEPLRVRCPKCVGRGWHACTAQLVCPFGCGVTVSSWLQEAEWPAGSPESNTEVRMGYR